MSPAPLVCVSFNALLAGWLALVAALLIAWSLFGRWRP